MSTNRRSRRQFGSALAAAAFASLCLASASAAETDPCTLIPKTTVAKIVGLPHAVVEPRETGSCVIAAWKGTKPDHRDFRARLNGGEYAALEIRVFELEASAASQNVKALIGGQRSRSEHLRLAPKSFSPPAFGAEEKAGIVGAEGPARFDQAAWQSPSLHAGILVFLVRAGKVSTVENMLVAAASKVVPAAGL